MRKVPGIAQGRRHHAQARHHQLQDAVGLDQADAHHRAGGAADRHHHAARRGAAPVQSWVLRGVVPMKYTGPTLAGKGGGDVAMEELVLSAQALEVEV